MDWSDSSAACKKKKLDSQRLQLADYPTSTSCKMQLSLCYNILAALQESYDCHIKISYIHAPVFVRQRIHKLNAQIFSEVG